jgi:hypothetical protein
MTTNMSKYLETKLGKDVITYIYRIIHKRNMKNLNTQYSSKFVYNYDYNMLTFYNDNGVESYCVHHRRYINFDGNVYGWYSRINFKEKRVNRFVKNRWLREHDGNNVIMLPNNY